MQKDRLITDIYDYIIELILGKIRAEYKDVVAKGYLNYLKNIYSDFEFNQNDYKKVINILRTIQYEKWSTSSELYILKELTYDENLLKIKSLSSNATSYAISRLETGKQISSETYIEIANQFDDLINKVYSFNRKEANLNIADGKMDLLFATGNSDNTSLRINPKDYPKKSQNLK